jgi:hypothetical protein
MPNSCARPDTEVTISECLNFQRDIVRDVFYLTNPTLRQRFPKSLGEDSVSQEERSSEVGLHTIQTCLRQMAKTSKVRRTPDLVKKPAVSGR